MSATYSGIPRRYRGWVYTYSMTRLRRLVPTGKVFFVTTNLQRGRAHFAPAERDLLCEVIAAARSRRGFRLPGFAVMPDHLHLLVLPAADDSLSVLMQDLKYASGRAINAVRRRKGRLWQKGFFDRFMRTPKEFAETLDYMHKNPVRKALVPSSADWQWSSARAYFGGASIIPVDFLDLSAQSEHRFS